MYLWLSWCIFLFFGVDIHLEWGSIYMLHHILLHWHNKLSISWEARGYYCREMYYCRHLVTQTGHFIACTLPLNFIPDYNALKQIFSKCSTANWSYISRSMYDASTHDEFLLLDVQSISGQITKSKWVSPGFHFTSRGNKIWDWMQFSYNLMNY